MKMKKTAAAVLAAVLATGTVSAVASASPAPPIDEVREESKYEITLDKEIVDGEEKAVVTFSGLPKDALTADYWVDITEDRDDGSTYTLHKELGTLTLRIIDEDEPWGFVYHRDSLDEDYEYKWSAGNISNYYYGNIASDSPDYPMTVEEEETTLTLKAYLDSDDVKITNLASKEKITVGGYARQYKYISIDFHDENKQNASGEEVTFFPIFSGEKVNLDMDFSNILGNGIIAMESVKITNNLNKPAESDPAESAVTPGATDEPAEEQTVLDVTLKNVDSENGIEGAALDKLLFGEGGWTWEQVEKIEFLSADLFSVQYKNDSGDWVKLGEEEAARADEAGIWNTAWTLDASEMGKDKYAKVIAKDGTINVTAKVYIKQGAAKPDGTDQKPTGIALAIAPVVLAAGAAVVVLSKRRK